MVCAVMPAPRVGGIGERDSLMRRETCIHNYVQECPPACSYEKFSLCYTHRCLADLGGSHRAECGLVGLFGLVYVKC